MIRFKKLYCLPFQALLLFLSFVSFGCSAETPILQSGEKGVTESRKRESSSSNYYDVNYRVKLLPDNKKARVEILISHDNQIRSLDFNLKRHPIAAIEANGKISRHEDRLTWRPPSGSKARLAYTVDIPHQRKSGRYDAFVSNNWALFRGDDLVPPAKSRFASGARSQTTLRFDLPKSWRSVNTGWLRDRSNEKCKTCFIVDNPDTKFDRPIGWIIAGKLGTRRELLGGTDFSVSAPVGSGLRRMDLLAFVSLAWPEFTNIFENTPPKILLVGAGDPMWRGGLSAPNSLFLHADRPMVSENGTSTLIHELVHVISGIHGEKEQDWIAEGIAEFYSFEILFRSGALSLKRKERVMDKLRTWSKGVTTLKADYSKGEVTAKAALFFVELDKEIRQLSKGRKSLDDITRRLMKHRKASIVLINEEFKNVTGKKSSVIEKWRRYF